MYFYVLLLYFLIFLLNCDLNTQKKNTIAVTGAIPFNTSAKSIISTQKDTLPFTGMIFTNPHFLVILCFDLLVCGVCAWRCLFLLLGCRELPEAQLLTVSPTRQKTYDLYSFVIKEHFYTVLRKKCKCRSNVFYEKKSSKYNKLYKEKKNVCQIQGNILWHNMINMNKTPQWL